MNVFIVTGNAGCGKGTLLRELASRKLESTEIFSTGERFRQILHHENHHPHHYIISRDMPKGLFLPDNVTADVFEEVWKGNPHLHEAENIFLDGVIRTIGQWELIPQIVRQTAKHALCWTTINVISDPNVCRERCLERAAQQNRPDDNPETIETRLSEFEKHAPTLIDRLKRETFYHPLFTNEMRRDAALFWDSIGFRAFQTA